MHRALSALSLCVVAGALGAWAFNPEDGSVMHSEPLWRAFGIAFEAGFLLLIVIAAGMRAAALIRRARRGICSH
jgi:hypothetical protein